ncbi:MAG: Fic family protein [Planctomycetes bacterium]|nr:Fic family protein [Planctomycetota bacterium]
MREFKFNGLQITPSMLKLIAEIDEFRGMWKAGRSPAPDRLDSLRRVATIESVGSSTRIEGARLGDREVEALLSNIDPASLQTRDEQEVAGYAEVMELVFESHEHIPLTENLIKQLHRDLLIHSSADARHRGQYKAHNNHVEAFDESGRSLGVVSETATPFETPLRMGELLAWFETETAQNELHPLLIAAVFSVVFLAIHPFQDGNGRLSRILTTLLLLKAGYTHVLYSSLETIIEQRKDAYYLALRKTQSSLDTTHIQYRPWIEFFLQSLHQQKERLHQKLTQEKLLEASLPKLSLQILTHIQNHERASVADLATITQTSRNTIKDHLKRLVHSNQLARHGKGRGTWYSLG